MINSKRKHLIFKVFDILNLKKLFKRTGILFITAILLIVGFFIIVVRKNHQDIILEDFSDFILKNENYAKADIYLKKIEINPEVNNSGAVGKQEYFGQGGGSEGIMEDIIDDNKLINIYAADINFAGKRNEILSYEIQKGDTLSSIAKYFGISIETILWANNLTTKSILRPGSKLEILPITGLKHLIKKGESLNSIATYYKSDIDKIIEFNNLPADGQITAGKLIIIPDGKMPIEKTQRRVTYNSALALKYGTTPEAPSLISAPVDVGYFIYPTTGRNWGRIHGFNGVDIATPCGTPVYAAASGDVIISDSSGWNGGYGKFIKIRHPNGVITLYSHMSKLLVGIGENVVKGQIIGLVGSTGRSTGCHLHWEVRGAKNPLGKY